VEKIPKKMRGVYLTGHGDLDRLEYRNDIPTPIPGPYDVLIKIGAAGVNNTDINTRKAWYSKGDGDSQDASWSGETIRFPRIQGIDVCGTIVKVGENVGEGLMNKRVLVEPCIREANGKRLETPWFLGSECDGGFAEYLVVDSKHAYPIESPMSDIELASFPCSYSTAENLLTRSSVTSNDIVLITGASGGVGSAAVQLVKARNAHVIAVTSPSKSDSLIDLGADQILFREDDLIQKLGINSVDVVIDLVAGNQWPQYLEVLRPGGRYAVAGAVAGPLVQLDVRTLYLKDLRMFGCTVLEPEVFINLINYIEQDKIKPIVAQTFTLEEICEAQTLFMKKQHVGKFVLKIRT